MRKKQGKIDSIFLPPRERRSGTTDFFFSALLSPKVSRGGEREKSFVDQVTVLLSRSYKY